MKANQGKLRTREEWAALIAGKDATRIAQMIFDCLSGYSINGRQDVATLAAAVEALRSSDSADGLLDLARNVGGFDDSLLLSSDLNMLRATLREFREHARAAISHGAKP